MIRVHDTARRVSRAFTASQPNASLFAVALQKKKKKKQYMCSNFGFIARSSLIPLSGRVATFEVPALGVMFVLRLI